MPRKPTAAALKTFRTHLLALRREISGTIHHLEEGALGSAPEKVAADGASGGGSDSFSQEFSLELLERDEETFERIDAALEKLEAGSFGRCETCEEWIAHARLSAVPYAENCIACQRKLETGT